MKRFITVARAAHAAARLPSGEVLVLGGCTRAGCDGETASAELYRPGPRTFAPTRSMTRPRSGHAAVSPRDGRLRSGDVLVAGGAVHVERYNPGSGRFGGPLPLGSALSFSTATELVGGFVLITGGYDERIVPTARAWFYGMP
jgi:hypothetical protein